MTFNIPIVLTWLRIAAIPLFVVVLYVDEPWLSQHQANVISMWIFILAAVTDWLDGYLARRLNQTSAFGAFLDPVADKLMVAAALIVLVELARIDAIVALIIIGREITISALREWMAQLGQAKSVAVSMLGKIKTVSQLVAIPFLLFDGLLFGLLDCRLAGRILIWIAAILTIWSMMIYLKAAFVPPHDKGGP
ncbi:MAG TPA: CDP-diacylglycerol--glycerol-3-phosphate 3-phosphatidyltransferase [Usitatibacteraceae bacterium]|nr:CDP-diacylglycerol--glycerol-3-phosphate 3-phosphatidyltransferase [Usitatibacteraceae bacterium]